MARKPNYRFERKERDRRKAEKKAAKQKAKDEAAGGPENSEADVNDNSSEDAGDSPGSVAEDGRTQTEQTGPSGLRVDSDIKT
jgi:hypothetical protein